MISSNRRQLALALILALFCLSLLGCGEDGSQLTKADFIRYSHTTVTALTDVVPLLKANNISTVKFEKAIDIGDRLVTAFENSQNSAALDLTSALITAFEEIVAEVDLIKDQRVKTVVLVGLAAGHIALTHLADLMDDTIAQVESGRFSVPGVMSWQNPQTDAAKATIKAFKKKKQWRCKNATTGRFEKMEFCKLNPETSYVVTFYKKK
jgi:hypothetical protein